MDPEQNGGVDECKSTERENRPPTVFARKDGYIEQQRLMRTVQWHLTEEHV